MNRFKRQREQSPLTMVTDADYPPVQEPPPWRGDLDALDQLSDRMEAAAQAGQSPGSDSTLDAECPRWLDRDEVDDCEDPYTNTLSELGALL